MLRSQFNARLNFVFLPHVQDALQNYQFDPRCSFYDPNSNDPDVWVKIVIREMSIRSVVSATSVVSPDNRYDITSSMTSWRWMPPDTSSSSSTDSDMSSTETSSSERTVNSIVKEALVQAELEYSDNVEYCTRDVYDIVPKRPKDDVDDNAVDNSCAWFWCKTHRDEVKIVENPKYVRRINNEVTLNETAPVFECDPHLPNTTCVESYTSKEIESVADALSDVRDTSSSPFRNSLVSSKSSFSLCFSDESISRETQLPVVKSNVTVTSFVKESHVQAELQNDDTQLEPPFHIEDTDEKSENVDYRKGDVDEIDYDNNNEETQNATAAVFDPHTFNATSVESCKSRENESVADALPDVHVEESRRKQSKIAKLLKRFFRRK
ncbi:hypothetical protein DPMN_071616 [Dreissena polymorpha]|uniref:Uncharacterized protein n=1 Tax=Dreissena polymorpha TaxID=45954 RepID=A0A9D3Z7B5_DREPO|nr:hypothetical protein DPMN_071616 [Dreissena polymorpha]